MKFSIEPTGVMCIHYYDSDILPAPSWLIYQSSLITITPVSHYAHFN